VTFQDLSLSLALGLRALNYFPLSSLLVYSSTPDSMHFNPNTPNYFSSRAFVRLGAQLVAGAQKYLLGDLSSFFTLMRCHEFVFFISLLPRSST
jgi:hypothetical protein